MTPRRSGPLAWALTLAVTVARCSSPSTTDFCLAETARETRCHGGPPPHEDAQCTANRAYVIPAIARRLVGCVQASRACGGAADRAVRECAGSAMLSGITAAGYQRLVGALCNACPSEGATAANPTPTTTECVRAGSLVVPPSSDGSVLGAANPFVLFAGYSDAALDPIAACIGARTSSGAEACAQAHACFNDSRLFRSLAMAHATP